MLNFEYFLNLEKKNLPLHRIIINNISYDFLMGLHELPIKRMKAGEVILAGKINGRWGGLRISKH